MTAMTHVVWCEISKTHGHWSINKCANTHIRHQSLPLGDQCCPVKHLVCFRCARGRSHTIHLCACICVCDLPPRVHTNALSWLLKLVSQALFLQTLTSFTFGACKQKKNTMSAFEQTPSFLISQQTPFPPIYLNRCKGYNLMYWHYGMQSHILPTFSSVFKIPRQEPVFVNGNIWPHGGMR